jgi:hypothetical protein
MSPVFYRFSLLVLGLPCLVFAAQSTKACRAFPLPGESTTSMVAQDMVMNGVPMAIKELRSKQAPEQVQRFFLEYWKTQGQRVLENKINDWQTLATQDGPCFFTVQTKPGDRGGTYALLGVTRAPEGVSRAPGSGFPMMSRSRVFNDLAHKDGPKSARTLLLDNEFSAESNAVFYRNTLAAQGWENRLDRQVDTGRVRSHVQVWQRQFEELSLTIASNDGMTRVVANVVDRP